MACKDAINTACDEIDTISEKTKEALIASFKEYPCLWLTTDEEFKNKARKTEATSFLASKFNISIDSLKRLIHSMRTSMLREVKRAVENPAYVSKWKFFSNMNYLKESILKSIKKHGGNLWPEEDVNTLIEFYQENVCLWNHHLETYKDRNLKEATFSRISEILPIQTASFSCLQPFCFFDLRFGAFI